MQWTVSSNDGQVALEMGDSSGVIRITSLKLSMNGQWSEYGSSTAAEKRPEDRCKVVSHHGLLLASRFKAKMSSR
jgi:hypothetical protein